MINIDCYIYIYIFLESILCILLIKGFANQPEVHLQVLVVHLPSKLVKKGKGLLTSQESELQYYIDYVHVNNLHLTN